MIWKKAFLILLLLVVGSSCTDGLVDDIPGQWIYCHRTGTSPAILSISVSGYSTLRTGEGRNIKRYEFQLDTTSIQRMEKLTTKPKLADYSMDSEILRGTRDYTIDVYGNDSIRSFTFDSNDISQEATDVFLNELDVIISANSSGAANR